VSLYLNLVHWVGLDYMENTSVLQLALVPVQLLLPHQNPPLGCSVLLHLPCNVQGDRVCDKS
jgi:hypothetical protein